MKTASFAVVAAIAVAAAAGAASADTVNVKFVGTIDSQIVLKTAQIQGGNQVYDLKSIFSAAELRAFNYLINCDYSGRARVAA